ncbi:MAG: DUF1905 domain-containing protein [Methanoregulaceae archaeon]|nr:DUF1905 domain-containing protein [Methanoregulaceae archaeon]
MTFSFSGPVWYWRGPAPFYFVTVPEEEAREIKAQERLATYGWGMIPVEVTVGESTWTTSLWPKDGRYVVPLKTAVRRAEQIEEGQVDDLRMTVLMHHS